MAAVQYNLCLQDVLAIIVFLVGIFLVDIFLIVDRRRQHTKRWTAVARVGRVILTVSTRRGNRIHTDVISLGLVISNRCPNGSSHLVARITRRHRGWTVGLVAMSTDATLGRLIVS